MVWFAEVLSKGEGFQKAKTPAQLLILNLVVKKPGIYVQEIQEELHNTLFLEVDISTICRFLYNSGMTRQNLCLVAKRRDEFIHLQYRLDVSVYKPDMFIFLDETGAERQNAMHKKKVWVQFAWQSP